jgi:hypothetical protein
MIYFDTMISFLDSLITVQLFLMIAGCFIWKQYPVEIEASCFYYICIGIFVDLLVAAGSLQLDWTPNNFVYRLSWCLIEASISFVQIFGMLAVLKLFDNVVLNIVSVYLIQCVNVSGLKSFLHGYISDTLNVEDNTHTVTDLILTAIGTNIAVPNLTPDTLQFYAH